MTRTNNSIEVRPRLKLPPSTIERLKAIALKEHRDVTTLMELAIQEIAMRGYSDVLTVKGDI